MRKDRKMTDNELPPTEDAALERITGGIDTQGRQVVAYPVDLLEAVRSGDVLPVRAKAELILRVLHEAHPRKLTRAEIMEATGMSLSQVHTGWRFIKSPAMTRDEIGALPVMVLSDDRGNRGGTYLYGFDNVKAGNWTTTWSARRSWWLLQGAVDVFTKVRASLEEDLDAEYTETQRGAQNALDRMESFIRICGRRYGATDDEMERWFKRPWAESA
jgi:hypothetical protein